VHIYATCLQLKYDVTTTGLAGVCVCNCAALFARALSSCNIKDLISNVGSAAAAPAAAGAGAGAAPAEEAKKEDKKEEEKKEESDSDNEDMGFGKSAVYHWHSSGLLQ